MIRQSTRSGRPTGLHRLANRPLLAIGALAIAAAAAGSTVALAQGGDKTATRDRIVAKIHVTGRPNGIAADRDALWVALKAQQNTSTLVRIDVATGAVRKTIAIKGVASSTIRAGSSVWVGANGDWFDETNGTYREFDWKTGAVKNIIPFAHPVFGAAYGGKSVWIVVGREPATLVQVDAATSRVVGKPIRLDRSRVIGVAFGAGAIWATAFEDGKLIRVDAKTRRVTTAQVGEGPVGVVVAGGQVWVANRSSGTVSRIDPNTMRETGDRIRLGTFPTWITSAAGSVWVSNQSDGTVSRIDETTGETVGPAIRIAAPADDAAAHVMSAAGRSLWVVSATEHTLSHLLPGS
jgi:DNA-binding beta-propeller fold protein YncE